MKVTHEEMETVAVFDYKAGTWSIDSTVPKHIRRIRKIFGDDEINRIDWGEDGRPVGVHVETADESHILIRNKPKSRKGKQPTPAQLEALKQGRQKQK